jgi:hypothetical protein
VDQMANDTHFSKPSMASSLCKTNSPPFKPQVASEIDTTHFDKEFTTLLERNSLAQPVSGSVQEIFGGFTYVNPSVLDEFPENVGRKIRLVKSVSFDQRQIRF